MLGLGVWTRRACGGNAKGEAAGPAGGNPRKKNREEEEDGGIQTARLRRHPGAPPVLQQLAANGLVQGCIYSMVAMGFALVYNTTRVFHVAHGAVFTFGAYAFYALSSVASWPPVPAAGIAVIGSALLGALIERAVYAPLERNGEAALPALLSSLGIYVLVVSLIALVFGNESIYLAPGISNTIEVGGVRLTNWQVLALGMGITILPLFVLFLRNTYLGISLRAVRDDPVLAETLGINSAFTRVLAVSLGSALAGTAAILVGLDVGTDPHAGMSYVLIGAVAMIMGGTGTFGGPVVGGFLLGLVQSVIVWRLSVRWVEGGTFLILLLFLFFRPQGLIGRFRRVEEVAT